MLGLLASGCSGLLSFEKQDGAPHANVDISAIPDAVPRSEPRSSSGNPSSYVVDGRRYHVLATAAGYHERGIASWYGTKFAGHLTSSGEPYDMYAMTAAHRTLPIPSYLRVTNLRNGKSVVVRVNDRGPFLPNRIIDLSYAAAVKLGIEAEGTGLVQLDAITPGRPAPRTAVATTAPAPLVATSAATPLRARPGATRRVPSAPSLYLQVGAFASRHNAERLRSRLTQATQTHIHIQPTAVGARSVYRVRLGPIATVQQVDALTATLNRLGISHPRIVIE